MIWIVCKDVVVQFGVYDGCVVFLEAAACTVGGEGGEEVVCEIRSGYGRWACDGRDVWEDVLVSL